MEKEYQFSKSKWTDLTKKEIIKLKLEKFDKYNLPINNIYLSWGGEAGEAINYSFESTSNLKLFTNLKGIGLVPIAIPLSL
jgi:hypothetical protein